MIEVSGVVTREHNRELTQIVRKKIGPHMSFASKHGGPILFVSVIVALGAFQALISTSTTGNFNFDVWLWTLIGILTGWIAAIVGMHIYTAGYFAVYLRDDGFGLGPRAYTLTDDQLVVRGPNNESRARWAGFLGVSAHKSLVAVWTDPGVAFLIPRDAIGDEAAVQKLVDFVEVRIAEANNVGANKAP